MTTGEKLALYDALSDAELLALLAGKAGAKKLLARFGGVAEIAAALPAEVVEVVGERAAERVGAAFRLGSRVTALREFRHILDSPAAAAAYLRERWRGQMQEELRIFLLDVKNRIIREESVTMGLLDRSQAHPREVFRAAIRYGAARVLLAHNHPSGDPAPSQADLQLTRELTAAGKLIGIQVIDHVIVGTPSLDRPHDYYSFREQGLLAAPEGK